MSTGNTHICTLFFWGQCSDPTLVAVPDYVSKVVNIISVSCKCFLLRSKSVLSYKDRLRTLGLSSMEKRSLRGSLMAPQFNSLRKRSAEGDAGLFSLGISDGMQGRSVPGEGQNGYQEKFLCCDDGQTLPREAVDAPHLSVLKRHLDNALGNII